MNTNIFIYQLPEEKQEYIKHLLSCYLHDSESIVGSQAQEIIENIVYEKLSILENIIDLDDELITNDF